MYLVYNKKMEIYKWKKYNFDYKQNMWLTSTNKGIFVLVDNYSDMETRKQKRRKRLTSVFRGLFMDLLSFFLCEWMLLKLFSLGIDISFLN